MPERFEGGAPSPEIKENRPEKYVASLSRLFADDEILNEIQELENSPITGDQEVDDLIVAKHNKEIEELKKKALPDVERDELLNSAAEQLQKDVVLLYESNPKTLGKIMESRKTEFDNLINALAEVDPAGNPASYNARKMECLNALDECLREVAKENGWKIQTEAVLSAGDAFSRNTFISDGQSTVNLNPSINRLSGGSALGSNVVELEKQIGPSHLRKHISLLSGTDLRWNHEAEVFSIERGNPHDIHRVPTEEEVAFLEKVIASYY